MAMLVVAFPDFDIRIEDIIQDGNKRSTITGTQQQAFAGLPATGRSMRIQAVDIHDIENGKIVRTWHTEDWMTGLRNWATCLDRGIEITKTKRDERQAEWSPVHEVRGVRRYRLGLRNGPTLQLRRQHQQASWRARHSR
jgi:hypothetical protein